jgi:DNA-binding Xre family transcriptional regulator
MIRPRLHEIARKNGITNAYQFQKASGFPNSMAYYLWQREWQSVNLKTLNTLCTIFKCTPNDLLEFTPDPDDG